MTVDIFALRVVGARVRIEDSPNEQMNGIEGTIERVTRAPARGDAIVHTYVQMKHDGGRLIVSTRDLRLAR